MKTDARKTALSILSRLESGHSTLDALMDQCADRPEWKDRRERSLLNALVYGVLRWRGRLDFILSSFSKLPLHKVDPTVLNILRLGLFQIIYFSRVPKAAAVNSAVEMAKASAPPWVAGYVNAVLRRSAAEHRRVVFPNPSSDPLFSLSAARSFPRWLIRRWLKRYGAETTASLCDRLNQIPPITVRTNLLLATRPALLADLEPEVEDAVLCQYAPEGISFNRPRVSISELTAFKEGKCQIQDEAAQLVTLLLNPKPREAVLDACAGLGGKTGHIAQCMQNRGRLLAWDSDPKKLQKLEDDMRRLGITMVQSRPCDLMRLHAEDITERFDRILLDAPCSGIGVIRRNPDIKWAANRSDLNRFGANQRRLLASLAPLLNPGGVLVYAVCSVEPEENEHVIQWFLKNHAEFDIDRRTGRLPDRMAAETHPSGYFKTHPRFMDMDGFFAVRLTRHR
jgi:16S rRNA (cytosine967-C5)-methyltransferase